MKGYILSLLIICQIIPGLAQKSSVFNFAEWVHPDSIVLPSPCDILPLSSCSMILDIDENNLEQKFTGGSMGGHSQSCFYKWPDPSTPHAGMLFQIIKNGVPENRDFISRTFQSKMTDGEFIQHLNKKVTFQTHKVGKVDIIYNPVTYSAYWHIGDNYMFHIIFNLNSLNQEKFLSLLNEMVPEINRNMLNHLLE
jgi:hypothetical protein